jgi:hypothetical protein
MQALFVCVDCDQVVPKLGRDLHRTRRIAVSGFVNRSRINGLLRIDVTMWSGKEPDGR